MKYSQWEKYEIIRLVEASSPGVRRTLEQIGVTRNSFYQWYRRYVEDGIDVPCAQDPFGRRQTGKQAEVAPGQIQRNSYEQKKRDGPFHCCLRKSVANQQPYNNLAANTQMPSGYWRQPLRM